MLLKSKKIIALCLILAVVVSCGAGCSQSAETAGDFSGVKIRLAQQYGMQYAPAYVVQQLGLLEKYLPGAEVEWSNLGGGSSMSEALISNQLDVAFMGIPPMLIAWDKGADFKIASGICVPPSELMVSEKSGIASLSDLVYANGKVAVPSIGSIQHIMLAIAAEK